LPFFLLQASALALAYFDAFLIFAVVAVVLAFLVLLMKRSVAGSRGSVTLSGQS
jgi:hypothetical protein